MSRVVGLILCVTVSPIVLIAAGIVGCLDGSPIYRHRRVGVKGKRFYLYKIRTMHLDADQRLSDMLKNKEVNDEWRKSRKIENDPRITTVGRFLRKYSIDELPQFANVLRGDLALIGPRPVTEEELFECYGRWKRVYLDSKPGLTGLWQVTDRGKARGNYKRRIALDRIYARSSGFSRLKLSSIILTRTVLVSLRGEGV